MTVVLSAGDNRIEALARTSAGLASLTDVRTVRLDVAGAPARVHVLAVGVATYARYSDLELHYPARDARALIDFIESERPDARVMLLPDDKAPRDAILGARTFLASAGPDDQVIVFFAGHGTVAAGGRYFFAPHDVNLDDLPGTALSFEQIESLLDGLQARQKLLLIDSCHSGESQDTVALGPPPDLRGLPVGRLVARPLGGRAAVTANPAHAVITIDQLFVDLRQNTGAEIIAAASGREFAYESDTVSHGLFTFAVLEALRDKKADRDTDGIVRVSELERYVASRVYALTRGAQQPVFRSENVAVDFAVVPRPADGGQQ